MHESICLECDVVYNPHTPDEPHYHEDGTEHPGHYLGNWGSATLS